MAAIQNDRDVLLQAAAVRLLPVTMPPNWTVNPGQIPGLGDLALQDRVNLTTQITGALAAGYVDGLGALALLNTINLGTQTTGALDANTQVNNLGVLAFADQLAANQIGAGTLAAGVIYAGDVLANQIDSRGLSIYTPSGVLVLDASRKLQRSDLVDLGVLAALDSLALGGPELTGFGALAGLNTVNTGQVVGLGALATQSAVNLTSQVTGALANANVSGLGALALLNVVNLNTQTTGALNGATQVTNLGTLAYANSIAANQIGAGTLAAGVVYAGSVNADQINAGIITGRTLRTTASTSGNQVIIDAAANNLAVRIDGTVRARFGGVIGDGLLEIDKGGLAAIGIWVNATAGDTAILAQQRNTTGAVAAVTGRGYNLGVGVEARSSGNQVALSARATTINTGHGNAHGFRGECTRMFTSGIVGSTTGHAFYSESGGYGPFTGSHDALMVNGHPAIPGDIMIDGAFVDAQGVDDVLQIAELSSGAGQSGAIGVLSRVLGPLRDHAPAACIVGRDEETRQPVLSKAWEDHAETHTLIAVNSLGEGQIAVCGRGGDLALGDLIICSDMAGKGMRQPDDTIRSRTVARARVAVTFSHPDEVQLVPCIYLCG